MLTNKREGSLSLDEKEKRKYLFLRQVETLDSFLANGAISRKQYLQVAQVCGNCT